MFKVIEQVIHSTKFGRERMKFMLERVEKMRERMAPKGN
jgi:hypothetical protein